MRTPTIVFAFVCALLTVSAFAQRRPATEAEAQSYIMSAFLSQADPGSMSPGVALGPELEEQFRLPSGTDRAEVYEAVMSLTGEQRLEVRRATPAGAASSRTRLSRLRRHAQPMREEHQAVGDRHEPQRALAPRRVHDIQKRPR